ncbi:MAG: prepilin-type N-terminal cleavage/methylation domain-containing protein [Fibrobacterales bacterium]
MNSRGFTLVELMVYLFITAIIATLAGRIFLDSVTFSKSSRNKIDALQGVGEAFMYVVEDIERMGNKMNLESGMMSVVDPTYINLLNNPHDSSSYILNNNSDNNNSANTSFDKLQYKTTIQDSDGEATHIEDVSYGVDNGTLFRTMQSFSILGTVTGGAQRMIIAENVSTFKVDPGLNVNPTSIANPIFQTVGIQTGAITVDDNVTQVLNANNSTVVISGFLRNTFLVDVCPATQLRAGRTYSLNMNTSFNDSFYQSFSKGTDRLAIRLVKNDNTLVPGTYIKSFYPGTGSATHQRIFTFIPSEDVMAKPQLYFTFTMPGLPTDIAMTLSDVSFFESNTGSYNWQTNAIATDSKKYVKGFKILLGVTIDGVTRQYSRIVATPNNGL